MSADHKLLPVLSSPFLSQESNLEHQVNLGPEMVPIIISSSHGNWPFKYEAKKDIRVSFKFLHKIKSKVLIKMYIPDIF